MSVQAAVLFIHRLRTDEALRLEVAALEGLDSREMLTRLVTIGGRAGFQFSIEELHQAHGHDWAMRWAHFHRADRPPQGNGRI